MTFFHYRFFKYLFLEIFIICKFFPKLFLIIFVGNFAFINNVSFNVGKVKTINGTFSVTIMAEEISN